MPETEASTRKGPEVLKNMVVFLLEEMMGGQGGIESQRKLGQAMQG